MRYPFAETIRRSRVASSLAIISLAVGVIFSSGVAQARVDTASGGRTSSDLSTEVVAKVTGGGTVVAAPLYTPAIASFGINATRPVGFTGGGGAEGRINYNRHKNSTGRHVNVPVVFMEAVVTMPPSPNGTGGEAILVGDCDAPNVQCPTDSHSAIVYAKDLADSGAGQDVFQIYFCTTPAGAPPPGFVPGATNPSCDGPEGGNLRTGNIQIRGEAGVVGEMIGTASASGAYNTTPNLSGVELAGGTFGIGVRSAGPGDLEAQFNGINPLFGLFQQVTVTGWITSATVNGSTMTLSGTASLDMGDGAPPTTGLPLAATLTATGLSITVGGWSLGTLPMADGFIKIE
jgi:hypothetical protein